MISIQRRLGLGLALGLLLAGALVLQGGYWLFDHALRSYLHDHLRDDSENLMLAVVRGQERIELNTRALDVSFNRPFSGRYFRIDLAGQSWRSRSLWDFDLPKPAAEGLAAGLQDGPRGQKLLVYRADYRKLGQSLSITVAQDYTPLLNTFRQALFWALALGALVLLSLLLIQAYLVRSALRPLQHLGSQLRELQTGQRQQLDLPTPMELAPLVAQLNRLLKHTTQTLQRSRQALGNLGHALKTPLAVLVSVLREPKLTEQDNWRAQLEGPVQLIQQRLARELGRARLAGEVLPGAYFCPQNELPLLFAMLDKVHDRGLDWRWQADPSGMLMALDREDMLELLGNLLDNAGKWADSQVLLSFSQLPEGWQICVDDDGPGIAAEQRAQVLARGSRLDEQVQGHGLGLGIVSDIAHSWQAQLFLEGNDWGGLRVRLWIPRTAHSF